ncbi:MAG: hypothetical protein QGG40_04750, partial [Myxococcota bacterium]|nr:hypothetical protein [Myxococcota bacterium]
MIIWLVAATAWAQDCDDWGEVTPASRTALPGETIKYSVDGLPVCGNKETCTWWVDDDLGLVEPGEGSPVFWTAPDEDDLPSQMSNCEKYTFQIHASCPDLNTASWGQITLQCSEFETRDSSV